MMFPPGFFTSPPHVLQRFNLVPGIFPCLMLKKGYLWSGKKVTRPWSKSIIPAFLRRMGTPKWWPYTATLCCWSARKRSPNIPSRMLKFPVRPAQTLMDSQSRSAMATRSRCSTTVPSQQLARHGLGIASRKLRPAALFKRYSGSVMTGSMLAQRSRSLTASCSILCRWKWVALLRPISGQINLILKFHSFHHHNQHLQRDPSLFQPNQDFHLFPAGLLSWDW